MSFRHLNDLIAAVRVAARLAEERSCLPGDLQREVYLGLYANRCVTCAGIADASAIMPHLDLEFVRFVTSVEVRPPPSLTFPVLRRHERGAIFEIMGVTVQCADDGAADTISIPAPAFLLYGSPGFIARLGDRPPGTETSRIYVALSPEQATWFVGRLFETLRDRVRGLSAKLLANPLAYARADAAVIYIDSSDLDDVLRIVTKSIRAFDISLRPVCPLGTRQVQTGLAWADSPDAANGSNQSFGELVTSILIEAAVKHDRTIGRQGLRDLIQARNRCPNALFKRRDSLLP